MVLLIVAGVLGAAGGGAVLGAQKRRKELAGRGPKRLLSGRDDEVVERTVSDVRVGDVVAHDSQDFVVEGTIHYDEDGHRWVGGRMCDGQHVRWLMVGVEGVGGERVRIYEEDSGAHEGGPPPEVIATAGARYTLDRRGTANAKIHGNAGALIGRGGKAGMFKRCRFWRYEAAGGHGLVIEEWDGGAFRALRGRTIGPGDLDLIPGS